MGLSLTVFTLAVISGASAANLSSTSSTPSLVGMTATLPPLPMITYRLSVTFSIVSGGRCAWDHTSHNPARPIPIPLRRIAIDLLRDIGEEYIKGARACDAEPHKIPSQETGPMPALSRQRD